MCVELLSELMWLRVQFQLTGWSTLQEPNTHEIHFNHLEEAEDSLPETLDQFSSQADQSVVYQGCKQGARSHGSALDEGQHWGMLWHH